MITSRGRLKSAPRRPLPDLARVVNLCFWRDLLERWRLESLPAGSEPPDFFGRDDPVRRALESDAGVPLEAMEEELGYPDPETGETPGAGSDAEEVEIPEGAAPRIAEVRRGYALFLDLGTLPPAGSPWGGVSPGPAWDDGVGG